MLTAEKSMPPFMKPILRLKMTKMQYLRGGTRYSYAYFFFQISNVKVETGNLDAIINMRISDGCFSFIYQRH